MLLKALTKPFIWIYLGLTLVLKTTFTGIFQFVKNVGVGMVTVLSFVGKIIKFFLFGVTGFVFKYIGVGFKNFGVLGKKLFMGLIAFFRYIFLGVYYLFRYVILGIFHCFKMLFQLLLFVPKGIMFLLKAMGDFFVVFYKKAIKAPIIFIKDKLTRLYHNIISGLKNMPKAFRDKSKGWFNNIQFVKHARNKREMQRQALLIDFNSKEAERSEKKIVYKYTAKNPDGKIISGVFEAYSKVDVHSFLISEGYEVYDITTSKMIEFLYGKSGNGKKMKPKQLIFFLSQLSTYIKAGVPLTDSVRILSKQEKKASTRRMFQGIIYELTMGESFSEALNKQGNVFPKLLVNMIKTSEMTGELTEALDDMTDYYATVDKSRKQTISSLSYPTVVFVLSIIVLIFIMVFVVPQFVNIYGQAGAKVPMITKVTIAISAFLQNYIVLLAFALVGLIILFIVMYKNIKFFRSIVQWIIMHIPVIGKIMIYNEITMFSKTFASLLKHNVFITDSMEILSKITDNEIYKMLVFDTISNLARGESISASFKGHWAVPVIAYEMMVTGERTGQLPVMMERVADYFQEQQQVLSSQLKALLEPAVIVFLAVTVGLILMSVVIPMFDLYSTISNM